MCRSGRSRAYTPHRPLRSSGSARGDAIGRHLELGGQQLDEFLGHVRADLEPQGPTEPAAAELHLDRHQEIVRLILFERQVGVAGDAEGVVLPDAHPGEQGVEVRAMTCSSGTNRSPSGMTTNRGKTGGS